MEQQIGITAHGHCQQCTREIILFRAQSFCAVLNAVTNTREQELPHFCRNPRRNKQLLAVCLQQRHQMLHQRREMLIEQRAGVDQEGVARGESFQVLLRSAPAVLLLSRQVAQQRFRVSRREQSVCRAYAAFIQQHRHFLFVKPHGAGGLPGRDHCGNHHIGSSFRYFLSIIRSQAFRLISGRLDFLFSCAPYLLIVVCLAFFRAGSENLPTCVFQVRFSPRNHGVRGNECQKRSVVSVWYAQNSLPFCTEVWYTTLTGCEDPTKMLMRVCTLLLMQPAPLTGTATGAAYLKYNFDIGMQPAPLTGTATYFRRDTRDAARMQPAPLTGTATTL